MAVLNYAASDPRLGDGAFRLLSLMVGAIRQPDGRMIAGDPKLSRSLGKSEKRISAYLAELRESKYLHLAKPAAGRGRAAEYELGSMFSHESAMRCQQQVGLLLKRGSRVSPFAEKGSKISGKKLYQEGGQEFTPQPISQPIHTHKEKPAALKEENWMARGKEKFPGWDLADMKSSFLSALQKGEAIGDWRIFQDKCHVLSRKRLPSAGLRKNPSSYLPSTRPIRSSCESPRTSTPFDGLPKDVWYAKSRDWYDLGSESNWEKVGRPHLPSSEKIKELRAKL
ncbi:hypothetical protein EBX31_15080, partial [bacterium]|nr:hypothetical protein [bacterium]